MEWIKTVDKKPKEKEGIEIIACWFIGFCQDYTNFYKTENVVKFLTYTDKFGWIDNSGNSHKDFDCYREIKAIKK